MVGRSTSKTTYLSRVQPFSKCTSIWGQTTRIMSSLFTNETVGRGLKSGTRSWQVLLLLRRASMGVLDETVVVVYE